MEDLYTAIVELPLSTPTHHQKVDSDFLKRLELKFLDTRGMAPDMSGLSAIVKQKFDIVEDAEAGAIVVKEREESGLEEEDFNALIYANVSC